MNRSLIASSVSSKHSEQLYCLNLLFRTTLRIIKLETKSLWQETVHALDMALFGIILLHFNLILEPSLLLHLQSVGLTMFTIISQGFSKTCIPLPCMCNSKNPSNQNFWIFSSLSIYYSSPLCFQILLAPLF